MPAATFKLEENEFFNNPTARVPVCLVLDISVSMRATHAGETQTAIDALNIGVAQFFKSANGDDIARFAADVAVVSFGEEARVVQEFGPVNRMPPHLQATGSQTYLGQGVQLALDLLETRKAQFKAVGIGSYQPWLVVMTDGQPTDLSHVAVAAKVADMVRNRKLTVFPIGVGSEADMGVLAAFTPTRPPFRLKGMQFSAFFEWLSASVTATSHSMPGEELNIDLGDIRPWNEFEDL